MKSQKFNNLALSENGFLFDAVTGNTFTLNKTGKLILQGLINGISKESIATELVDIFEVNEEVAISDTEQFFHQLEILEVVPRD